jgi:hypothetical protein
VCHHHRLYWLPMIRIKLCRTLPRWCERLWCQRHCNMGKKNVSSIPPFVINMSPPWQDASLTILAHSFQRPWPHQLLQTGIAKCCLVNKLKPIYCGRGQHLVALMRRCLRKCPSVCVLCNGMAKMQMTRHRHHNIGATHCGPLLRHECTKAGRCCWDTLPLCFEIILTLYSNAKPQEMSNMVRLQSMLHILRLYMSFYIAVTKWHLFSLTCNRLLLLLLLLPVYVIYTDRLGL